MFFQEAFSLGIVTWKNLGRCGKDWGWSPKRASHVLGSPRLEQQTHQLEATHAHWCSKDLGLQSNSGAKRLLPALAPVWEKLFEGRSRKWFLQPIAFPVALRDATSTFLTSGGKSYGYWQRLPFRLQMADFFGSWKKGRNSFSLMNIFHTFIHIWKGCNLWTQGSHRASRVKIINLAIYPRWHAASALELDLQE